MSRRVRKSISVSKETYEQLKKHSLLLGIPLGKIASYLCNTFLEDEDKQKLDHRDIMF